MKTRHKRGVFATIGIACALVAAFIVVRSRTPRWIRNGNYRVDALAGHVRNPYWSASWEWEEHPLRKIVLRTNNLGLREDHDTVVEKPPGVRRIVVTGDSHTEGAVYNHESFANRLEAMLNAAADGATSYEVVNAGCGHYGPQNYVGALRSYLTLRPDVFVVGLYTGNDFLNALEYAERHSEIRTPRRPREYHNIERFKEIDGIAYPGLGQGINQLHLFRTFPDLEHTALELTRRALAEVRALALAAGIELVVVVIPTLLDVEWERDAARNDMVKKGLGLQDHDMETNREVALELIDWMRDAGIAHVDVAEAMGRGRRSYFWVKDHHLSVAGHRLIARRLFHEHASRLAAGLARPQRASTSAPDQLGGPPSSTRRSKITAPPAAMSALPPPAGSQQSM